MLVLVDIIFQREQLFLQLVLQAEHRVTNAINEERTNTIGILVILKKTTLTAA
jgi:hypothetical protein